MTTVSFIQADRSDILAKRFAYLASSYFEHPEEGRDPAAKIPLENLFRMLQMFQYDAFSDEARSGVLELKSVAEQKSFTSSDELWHRSIELALNKALVAAFGDQPKQQSIQEVQSVLRWLAVDGAVPSDQAQSRSKKFLEQFLAALD